MVKLMDVPKCFSFLEGRKGIERITKIRSDFFLNTRKFIENKLGVAERTDFEIKSSAFNYGSSLTNDKMTHLIYLDKYVVAGCIEKETPKEDKHYTFFRNLSCIRKELSNRK